MSAPEGTITNYGLDNGAPVIGYTIVEAYSYPGYVVKAYTTEGSMTGTSAITDVPVGCTVKSTVPATMQAIAAYLGSSDGSAQTQQFIGVQAFEPGREYYLHLGATAAVSVGDYMGPSTTQGKIQPRSATGSKGSAGVIFCVALEAAADQAGATAGTVIKVKAIAPMYLAAGACPT